MRLYSQVLGNVRGHWGYSLAMHLSHGHIWPSALLRPQLARPAPHIPLPSAPLIPRPDSTSALAEPRGYFLYMLPGFPGSKREHLQML